MGHRAKGTQGMGHSVRRRSVEGAGGAKGLRVMAGYGLWAKRQRAWGIGQREHRAWGIASDVARWKVQEAQKVYGLWTKRQRAKGMGQRAKGIGQMAKGIGQRAKGIAQRAKDLQKTSEKDFGFVVR
ncbi:MAG: hypothetical protein PVH85_30205 [Desulfobacterales bacterium]